MCSFESNGIISSCYKFNPDSSVNSYLLLIPVKLSTVFVLLREMTLVSKLKLLRGKTELVFF